MSRTEDDNYFEDFEPGTVYEHSRGKTMTEMDNVLVTNLVLNTAEGHFNEDEMRESEFGERIVFGGVNLSLVCGLASEVITENALTVLGMDEVRFTTPVFHGDTLYAESEVLETWEPEDAEEGGAVSFRVRGFNQDDEEVLGATLDVLVKKAPDRTHPRGGRRRSMSDGGGDTAGPLADVRVIDLTQMLAGPYATMVMADLGADVVKVEPPDGEVTREHQPHLVDGESYGGYFQSINRNKRSAVLDLKSDRGHEALLRLVEDADVLVENYREGTMDRLGLSYESLREVNQELVYASVRGFGDPRGGESPFANRPAFDIIAQAMGGLMSITGTEESGPIKAGPGVGDVFPGVLSVVGILSALRQRDRTGEGQYVDVGMVDSVLALCERIVHQYSHSGEVPGPQGNTHPLLFPFDRFETRDGHVMIAAPNDNHWERLCDFMDRPDLREEYPTNDDRLEAADDLRPEIDEWTQSHTKEELFDLLGNEVPCGPVNTVEGVFESEHFAARDMLEEVEHPDVDETVRIAGRPIKFPGTELDSFRRAPLLGEHTREVLSTAGYDEAEIDAMVGDGVAQTPEDGA